MAQKKSLRFATVWDLEEACFRQYRLTLESSQQTRETIGASEWNRIHALNREAALSYFDSNSGQFRKKRAVLEAREYLIKRIETENMELIKINEMRAMNKALKDNLQQSKAVTDESKKTVTEFISVREEKPKEQEEKNARIERLSTQQSNTREQFSNISRDLVNVENYMAELERRRREQDREHQELLEQARRDAQRLEELSKNLKKKQKSKLSIAWSYFTGSDDTDDDFYKKQTPTYFGGGGPGLLGSQNDPRNYRERDPRESECHNPHLGNYGYHGTDHRENQYFNSNFGSYGVNGTTKKANLERDVYPTAGGVSSIYEISDLVLKTHATPQPRGANAINQQTTEKSENKPSDSSLKYQLDMSCSVFTGKKDVSSTHVLPNTTFADKNAYSTNFNVGETSSNIMPSQPVGPNVLSSQVSKPNYSKTENLSITNPPLTEITQFTKSEIFERNYSNVGNTSLEGSTPDATTNSSSNSVQITNVNFDKCNEVQNPQIEKKPSQVENISDIPGNCDSTSGNVGSIPLRAAENSCFVIPASDKNESVDTAQVSLSPESLGQNISDLTEETQHKPTTSIQSSPTNTMNAISTKQNVLGLVLLSMKNSSTMLKAQDAPITPESDPISINDSTPSQSEGGDIGSLNQNDYPLKENKDDFKER